VEFCVNAVKFGVTAVELCRNVDLLALIVVDFEVNVVAYEVNVVEFD